MIKTSSPISWSRFLPAIGCAVLALSSSHGRTIITNDGFTQNNQPLPNTAGNVSSYGSNASSLNTSPNWTLSEGVDGIFGTPDIELLWANGQFDTYTNWDGRGNVVQLDSLNKPSHVFDITFLPSETAAVSVVSFDLDAWAGAPGGTDIVVNWSLTNLDASEVYAFGVFTQPGVTGGRSTIFTNYTGALGEVLVLRMDQIQGDGSYLAFDNLTFDQIVTVPEPSTVAFLGLGLTAGLFLLRRRSTALRSDS